DMKLVMGLGNRVLMLEYGRLLAGGESADIHGEPRVIEAYLGKGAATDPAVHGTSGGVVSACVAARETEEGRQGAGKPTWETKQLFCLNCAISMSPMAVFGPCGV